jgi:DNA-binding CsgD family transcriptional regulator
MERFGAAEKRLLEAVLPHLRRALQLRHRLDGAAAASAPPGAAALDALSMGVLVVDAELRVLVANAAAEAMTAKTGAALRFRRAALAELVRATALGGHAGGALRLRDAASTPALAALVMPLPRRLSETPGAGMGRTENRALVLLREVAAAPAAPRLDLLRGLFGLTRAEAEVARALSGGVTKRAVAEARGLREATVRTQFRAVLEKTGAANLRGLERMLASLQGM